MQRYRFKELRTMAKDQGVKQWTLMNKDQLCKALGIVRVEHIPKYTLTCVETLEVTKWRSLNAISKAFKTNIGNVSYALKVDKCLRTSFGIFVIKKILFSCVYMRRLFENV